MALTMRIGSGHLQPATRAHLRTAVTLMELIVALVVVGLLTAVVGLSARTSTPATKLDAHAPIVVARDSAIRSGVTVSIGVMTRIGPHLVTAFPDGIVITDSTVLLSTPGRSNDSTRR